MDQVVVGLIIHQNKILLGKKVVAEGVSLSGEWHIPGGHIELQESEIDALIREMKEETNLDIVVGDKIAKSVVSERNVEIHWYVCKPISFNLKAASDLTEASFMSSKEVLELCKERAETVWPKEVVEIIKSLKRGPTR